MKTILKQIKNEWNSNLFLFVELLLVFVVLWYIVDWTLVTARVYHAPMGFDTEHCYNITVSKLGEDSPLYNPELTADDDMDDLFRLTDRLRHCPGVEAVALSQNCFPYNEGSNGIDLGIDSVAVNVHLLWVEADFFRVFRYAFTEEAEFAKVEAAFRNDEPVVSSNLTEGHPELGGGASLLGQEVLLLNYGKDVRRRIGAVGTPVRWSHFHTPSQWGGAFAALPLNAKRLRNFGDPRYVTVSLRVSEDADKNFAEKLMNDADRLYQVGNLYLLDITPFSHLREICELEDMNEWKTQLCVLGFLLLNIFWALSAHSGSVRSNAVKRLRCGWRWAVRAGKYSPVSCTKGCCCLRWRPYRRLSSLSISVMPNWWMWARCLSMPDAFCRLLP